MKEAAWYHAGLLFPMPEAYALQGIFKVPGGSVNFACMRTRTALRLLLVELAVAVAAR